MKSHSMVMFRRNVKHVTRNPFSVFNGILMPVIVMLMFVYMMGDAFDVGVDYVDYSTPGLMALAVCYGLSGIALAVNSDMTKGIINRFKVMDVSRSAVLNGHLITSVLTNLVAVAALTGVAFLLGLDPAAGAAEWFGIAGMVVLLSIAAGWMTVAMGLAAKTPETAGMATVPLVMLPFFSSAIVPAESMGAGLKQFAEYQPLTPIIETVRGLLAGSPDGTDAIIAVAWCVGIAIIGYLWANATFKKRA
ncbi:ABC transporter permease [Glycomyces albus]